MAEMVARLQGDIILELCFGLDTGFLPNLWQGCRGNMWTADNFYRATVTDGLDFCEQQMQV